MSLYLVFERLSESFIGLRDEARRQGVRALRSALFGNQYVFTKQRQSAIGLVCASLGSTSWKRDDHAALPPIVDRYSSKDDLSFGQINVLLTLARRMEERCDVLARWIPKLIERHWRLAPYHLRMEIVSAPSGCIDISAGDRDSLIRALESVLDDQNPMFNSIVFDTLQTLGAFEASEIEHERSVHAEIEDVLDGSAEYAERCLMAYSIYCRQFDHPYSDSYSRVVNDLPPDRKETLLTMALQGTGDETLFVTPLIGDVAAFRSPSIGDALRKKTASPPARDSFMSGEALCVYLAAHLALGQLGEPLHRDYTQDSRETGWAFSACAHVLYWLNRSDLSHDARTRSCRPAIASLERHELGVSASALMKCSDSRGLLGEGLWQSRSQGPLTLSISDAFPLEVADICREALRNRDRQQSAYESPTWEPWNVLVWAIETLGRHGTRDDLEMLRKLADNADFSRSAVAAIKNIERRTD